MKRKLIFLAVLFAALSAFSAEYYVDASRPDDAGSATNWATAKQTIQAAVDLTVDGDTVWVTNGTYLLSAEISVTNAITIQSVNGSDETIVDGGGSNRCFNLSGECLVSGFTIIGGTAWNENGGGVHCENLIPVVSNCVFFANSTPTFFNLPGSGGGMFRGTAIDCVFDSNGAHAGGGMAQGVAQNCVFSNNYGIGDSQWGSSYGAGMSGGEARNCLFVDNGNCFSGAGMSDGKAVNCTFFGNHSQFEGGAFARGTVSNSLFADNISGFGYSEIADSEVFYSCSTQLAHGVNGNITNTPLFVDAVNGDFRLMPNSPCINSGNNMAVSTVLDLIGRNRIMNGTVDMGAYEHLTAYVSADVGNDVNSGQSWTNAKQTIQAAVDLTVGGDAVWVTNGTYLVSAEISVTNAITIQSVNGPDVTIVDGGGSSRCFNLGDSTCLVSGFTVTNGFSWDGAGIFCSNESPIVSNCVISVNTAYTERGSYGGGMFRGRASNCLFNGNKANFGGGMAEGIVYDCIFSNNVAENVNLQFFAHGAGQYKGEAVRCIFVENVSHFAGGGISLGTASGCLFINNSAAAYGGGISSGEALNCTFVSNSAYRGGGITDGSVGGTANSAYNCIFYENQASEEGDDFYNSTVNNSCSIELTHGINGNITNAPLFMNETIGDFRLQSNSPCINWGNNSYVTNLSDLAGNPRIVEGTVDMGAYEYQEVLGLTDSDGDELADDWERQFGGNQDPNRMSANNINSIRQAYIAGLDPTDPASRFAAFLGSDQVLRWNATSGRVYSVWCSTNLLSGFQCLETNIPWTSGQFDGTTNTSLQIFYKIDVQLDE